MALQGVPFIDTGNPLLSPVRANLDTGTVTQPDGTKMAVLTIRTASTTMTVMLTAAEFAAWTEMLTGLQAELGSPIRLATPDQLRDLGLNGQH
jgi:hypothetical protein